MFSIFFTSYSDVETSFYSGIAWLSYHRNQGNQRRYKADVLLRISVIKAAQKLGVNLEDIKQTLAQLPDNRTPTVEDWQQLSADWHQMLSDRITKLENLRDSLDNCIGCGCLSLSKCPLYNPDDKVASIASGPVLLDTMSL